MKYRDARLPAAERVEDLIARMTIKEKVQQLCCLPMSPDTDQDCERVSADGIGNVSTFLVPDLSPSGRHEVSDLARRIERIQRRIVERTRLGIPALFHCEAVNGVALAQGTAFPTAIGQASTWDPALIGRMAERIRRQVRAVGCRQILSPVFDISRDPRWGRLSETYGEDETLASAMAVAFVRGVQGGPPGEASVATGKHFVGHGVTEGGLNAGQNPITERELREVHCKPFQAAISSAGLMSVMNSYCSIDREAIVGSRKILTDLLRGELGFQGFVVSDYFAINRLLDPYQTAADPLEAGIKAIGAGVDVEYPSPFGFSASFAEAARTGRLEIEIIDRAVARILDAKFRIGLFESPFPDRENLSRSFDDDENRTIALQIAQELITLLKNDNSVLPASRELRRIAVIGPHADSVRSLFGSYSYPALIDMTADMSNNSLHPWGGFILEQRYAGDLRETPFFVEKLIRRLYPQSGTIASAIGDYVPGVRVDSATGVTYTGTEAPDYDRAVGLASQADLVILTLGGRNGWSLVATNGEGVDNYDIGLPGRQEQFARAIHALRTPTVVVHCDGRPLANEFVAENFDAIIEAWQLGEQGGRALASVIFGDYNPAGRLPVSAARSAAQLPVYYGMPRGSGYVGAGHFGVLSNRFGYANGTARPLFSFGHGLSYTTFEYSNMAVSATQVDPDGTVTVRVDVTNSGNRDGDEVVQLYASDAVSSLVRPERQLIGFKRLRLRSGETKTVRFSFAPSLLAFLDTEMMWRVEAGRVELLIGASSVDVRARDSITITRDSVIDPKLRDFYCESAVSPDT